ncbi:MAG: NYN domain-containing protein, partial [Flexibacteraceae bacterium]
MPQQPIRFAVFLDGNFLYRVSNFYKFDHPRGKRIAFNGILPFLTRKIADTERVEEKLVHSVESHWFKGRMTMNQLYKKYPVEQDRLRYLESERYVDDALMFEGITQHSFPLRMNQLGEIEEKGIDVWLANEALELTYLKKFDVVALVACDSDFVSLVRKLNGMGTKVYLISWDMTSTNGNETRTSQALINECHEYLPMHEIIDSRDSKNRDMA